MSNPSELDNLMITELEEIKSLYGQNRRSLISDDEGLLNREDMIKKEDVIVVLTEANYVKRMPNTEFKSQRRGGRGVNAQILKRVTRQRYLCALIPMIRYCVFQQKERHSQSGFSIYPILVDRQEASQSTIFYR